MHQASEPLQLSMSWHITLNMLHVITCGRVCTLSTSHFCCHQQYRNHSKSKPAGDCASTQAGVLQQQDEPVRGGHRGWLDAAGHGCQEGWQPLLWGRGCHGRESPWAEWRRDSVCGRSHLHRRCSSQAQLQVSCADKLMPNFRASVQAYIRCGSTLYLHLCLRQDR